MTKEDLKRIKKMKREIARLKKETYRLQAREQALNTCDDYTKDKRLKNKLG